MAAREDAYFDFKEATDKLQKELNYPPEKAERFVDSFDVNKDGKLSMAEFREFCKTVEDTRKRLLPKFKEYDTNNDGNISMEEAKKILGKPPFSFPESKVVCLLKKFDADGNGKLDIEEFADFFAEAKALNEKMQTEFDRLDTDGNGVLTVDEVKLLVKNTLHQDEDQTETLVKMFDSNSDGQLDKKEFMSMWDNCFNLPF